MICIKIVHITEGGKSNSGNPKGKWKPSGDESQPVSSKSGSPEPGHIKLKAAKTEVERLPPTSIKGKLFQFFLICSCIFLESSGKMKMKEKETLTNKTAVKGKLSSKTQSARLKGKTIPLLENYYKLNKPFQEKPNLLHQNW